MACVFSVAAFNRVTVRRKLEINDLSIFSSRFVFKVLLGSRNILGNNTQFTFFRNEWAMYNLTSDYTAMGQAYTADVYRCLRGSVHSRIPITMTQAVVAKSVSAARLSKHRIQHKSLHSWC